MERKKKGMNILLGLWFSGKIRASCARAPGPIPGSPHFFGPERLDAACGDFRVRVSLLSNRFLSDLALPRRRLQEKKNQMESPSRETETAVPSRKETEAILEKKLKKRPPKEELLSHGVLKGGLLSLRSVCIL